MRLGLRSNVTSSKRQLPCHPVSNISKHAGNHRVSSSEGLALRHLRVPSPLEGAPVGTREPDLCARGTWTTGARKPLPNRRMGTGHSPRPPPRDKTGSPGGAPHCEGNSHMHKPPANRCPTRLSSPVQPPPPTAGACPLRTRPVSPRLRGQASAWWSRPPAVPHRAGQPKAREARWELPGPLTSAPLLLGFSLSLFAPCWPRPCSLLPEVGGKVVNTGACALWGLGKPVWRPLRHGSQCT